jgi:uncharacterized membrane-anchored protein YjiN (DUF445 family)
MKRRATSLLALMAAAFVAVTVAGGDDEWVGYVRAAIEGSLVGGLADWFAVTAIFRHPLGIPIPHTAIIRARKNAFGEALGDFVQENFLSPDVVAERARAANVPARLATWLAQPSNAETVARYAGEVVIGVADVVRDDEVNRAIEEQVRRAVEALPVARIAGRALEIVTSGGRHQELLDVVLHALERFLVENRETLRVRFGDDSPWWLPGAVEDRIFERLFDGAQNLLHAVATDPTHETRRHFDDRVAELAVRLEHDIDLQGRGDQIKQELLEHPQLRAWVGSLWTELKASVRAQATDPESELHRRLANGIAATGRRLGEDAALQAKVEEGTESAARWFAEHFRDEIAGLVSGTISRWDPEETSDKLELLLGRDLQFIRINGTVIGGLAGLAIHATAVAL